MLCMILETSGRKYILCVTTTFQNLSYFNQEEKGSLCKSSMPKFSFQAVNFNIHMKMFGFYLAVYSGVCK